MIKFLLLMKKFNLTIALLFSSVFVFASADKDVATIAPDSSIGLSADEMLILALLAFAIVLLIAAVVLFNALKIIVKEQKNPAPFKKYVAPEPLDYVEWMKIKRLRPNIWTKILSLKPLEQEHELIIPHAYDGIHELDNPVPRWFNLLFLGTVIIAVSYLYYYHVGEYGEKQDQEYATEMQKAAEDKRKFLAKSADKIDENSVKIDQTLVTNGKGVFDANCVACHGDKAQGLVGPNLTDEFWLHGGSVNEIFKTVKYGVPAKGMVSWEKNLSSKNIAEVVNYIISLQGSKPANAKAPQGEKYESKSVEDSVKNESIPTK